VTGTFAIIITALLLLPPLWRLLPSGALTDLTFPEAD